MSVPSGPDRFDAPTASGDTPPFSQPPAPGLEQPAQGPGFAAPSPYEPGPAAAQYAMQPPPGAVPYGAAPSAQPYPTPYGAPPVAPPPGYGPPPGAWGYAGPYGYAPMQQKTSGLAIATLVTGICGFLYCIPALVAIGLGIAALKDIKRTGRPGKGMAIGGLVAAAVWIVLYILIIVLLVAAAHNAQVNYDYSN